MLLLANNSWECPLPSLGPAVWRDRDQTACVAAPPTQSRQRWMIVVFVAVAGVIVLFLLVFGARKLWRRSYTWQMRKAPEVEKVQFDVTLHSDQGRFDRWGAPASYTSYSRHTPVSAANSDPERTVSGLRIATPAA
eukprot:gene48320-56978_t